MSISFLSIIIVNYNGKEFLGRCLMSIAENASCEHEVIVVDNGSNDGSDEFVRKEFPAVRLFKSGRNLGFSGGNNLGAREARGGLLLLLNNDTYLRSSLAPAVAAFEEDTRIGALGCRMYYGDGQFQPSMGFDHTPSTVVLSWIGIGRGSFAPRLFRRVDTNELHYECLFEPDWVSGAFLMTRRELWKHLGGLDERYFMYIEDVDYCKRVRMARYRVVYTPQVEILHYEGGGKAWIGEKALGYTVDSYLVYMKKYHGLVMTYLFRAALSAVYAARSFVYCVLSLRTASTVYQEKRRGFLIAALRLIGFHVGS